MEPLAVEGDDAGGFLAAMLEGVQAERRDRGGVGVAEDAEDAALLAQPVVVEIEAVCAWSFDHVAHLASRGHPADVRQPRSATLPSISRLHPGRSDCP